MIVSSSSHKAVLLSMFYLPGTPHERRFAMAAVPVAAACVEKLKTGSTTTTSGGDTNIQLVDGEVDFTFEECALLRDLLSGLTEATPTEYRYITEVQQILSQ